MIDQLIEEMHAKVLARVPMTLTLEQTKEVLLALDRPFVHPGVPELAVVQEGGATEEAARKERVGKRRRSPRIEREVA